MAPHPISRVASSTVKAAWILTLVHSAPIVLAGLCAGCTSPARGYCEAAAACDEPGAVFDAVGESDDSVDVCTAEAEGSLAVLRANDEPECADAADALEAFYACVRDKHAEGEECAGLRGGNDNECLDDLSEVDESLDGMGSACTEDEE